MKRLESRPAIAVLLLLCSATLCLLTACSTQPQKNATSNAPSTSRPSNTVTFHLDPSVQSSEIVLYALGLLDTGYVFGGRNPDAGLDCSGMVSYVVEQVSGRRLPHNAAQIASVTQPIDKSDLRPADLVFFNTTGKTFSHMGIYLGDGKFVHAPSSKGQVRVEKLDNSYFAKRFTGARTLY